MFSPYYAWARRRGAAAPEQHVAVNLALYGPGGRWAMTERGAGALQRDATQLQIGPSRLAWLGDRLQVDIDERCAPLPRRLRGRLLLHPQALTGATLALDAAGRHHWSPLAPAARIEVELQDPPLRWQGRAYLDHNTGSEALEAGFEDWTWSRAAQRDGTTLIDYSTRRSDGSRMALALRVARDGGITPVQAPARQPLPRSAWGLARDAALAPTALRSLEDGPFYARALLTLPDGGHAMHETLSLQRFRQPWVQLLLPFRMPRRG